MYRIIAAGSSMKQVALSRNVQVPRWGPKVGPFSDHWPVSIDLQCPHPTSAKDLSPGAWAQDYGS